MSVPVYGHSGGTYLDAFDAIKQYINENGTTLSATAITPSGAVLYPAVFLTSERNRAISTMSDGIEMIIHEVNLVQREDAFDGRVKSVPQFKFTLGAYGVFGSPQLDLVVQALAEEYGNTPDLVSTYQTYSAYKAAIGDTANTSITGFVRGRTYTLLCGTLSYTGTPDGDVFTRTDLDKLLAAQASYSRIAFNTDQTIYADAKPATPDPLGTGGWYYRNTAGEKVNWYFHGVYPGSPGVTPLETLTSLFMTFYPRTTNTKAPYVAVYTRPKGDGSDAAAWYRSRIVYTTSNQTWTQHVPVLLHVGQDPAVDEELLRVPLLYNNLVSLGPQSPDEDVYLAAVGTDSAAATGAYEFATTRVGYESSESGTVVTSLVGIPQPTTPPEGPTGVTSINGLTGVVTLTADNIDDSTSLHQFVSAAQVNLINSAVQPSDNVSDLTNDAGYITQADLNRTVINCYNGTGSTLAKGAVVAVVGEGPSGRPSIALADADQAGLYPALGIVLADITSLGQGDVVVAGLINNVNTSTSAAGTSIYLSATPGQYTTTRPSGVAVAVQKLGVIGRQHATQGQIIVIGAGRTNDVPNSIDAVIGITNGASNLGTFTGTTIADNSSTKTALQALETAVEATPKTLDQLTDVTITTPSAGQVVRYNGSQFVNSSVSYSEVTGTPADEITDGIASSSLKLYNSSTVITPTSTGYSSVKVFKPVWMTIPAASGRYLEIDNNGGVLPMLIEFSGVIHDQGTPARGKIYSTGVIISKGIAKLGTPVTGSDYTLYLDYTAIGTNPYGGYFAYNNHTYAAVESSLDASATTANRMYFAIGYNSTNSRYFIAGYNTHATSIDFEMDEMRVYYK